MIEILVWFVTCLISTLGITYVYYKFSGVTNKINFNAFMVFVLGVVFVTFIQIYHIESLGHISFFIYYPILFYFMKPRPFKEVIFYVLIIWFYGTILDLLAMLVISTFRTFVSFNVYSLYYECILTFFVFLLFIMLGHSKKVKLFTDKLYKKICKVTNMDITLFIFSAFVLSMSVTIFFNLDNLKMDLLIILIVLLMTVVFVILIKYKIDADEIAILLRTLKENNDFYIKMDNENRIFKHNLNAKLMSVKSVSNAKTRVLLTDLLNEVNHNVNFTNNIKQIPYGLNGIIYEKVYPYINDLKITTKNDINYDIFSVLKPRRYNVLVEKMIIALDNAIEACLLSNKKILTIHIYDCDNSVILEIKNTFSSTLNMECLGSNGYSTKGINRGLGLFSAFRNNEANLEVKIINDLFVNKISAKKNYKYKSL